MKRILTTLCALAVVLVGAGLPARAAEAPNESRYYDDAMTRKFVEKITVLDAETIHVTFRDCGIELDQKLC